MSTESLSSGAGTVPEVSEVFPSAFFNDDALLRFDAESGALLAINETARVSLDLFSDTYDGLDFGSCIRVSDGDSGDLWWELSSGSRSGWKGGIVSTSGSATDAVFRGGLSKDGSTIDVIAIAAPSAGAEKAGDMALFEAAVGIIEYDADGVIVSANERATIALEFLGTDIVGRHHDTLWPRSATQTPEYVEFWEKLRTGRIIEGQFEHVSGVESPVWLQCTYLPVRNESGFVERVFQVALDVSDNAHAARENERFLEAFRTKFAYAEIDAEGHVSTVNDAMLECYRLPKGDVIGKRFDAFCDDEFMKSGAFEEAWQEALNDAKPRRINIRHVTSEALKRWMEVTLVPVVDDEGAVVKVVQLARDTHKELTHFRTLEAGYNAFDRGNAIAEFGIDGRVRRVNKGFCEILHIIPEEIEGVAHQELCDHEFGSSRRHTEFWDKLVAGEVVSGVFRRISPTGGSHWLRSVYCPVIESNGRIQSILLVASDVTERQEHFKRIEQKLEALDEIACVIDHSVDGEILTASARALESLDLTPQQIRSRTYSDLVPEDDTLAAKGRDTWQQVTRGERMAGEFLRGFENRTPAWFQGAYSPLRNTQGEIDGVFFIGIDITEARRRLVEYETKGAATNASLGQAEFDIDGNLLEVNDNLLKLMGHSRREMIGEHHSAFCSPDFVQTQEYREFWLSLARGESWTGLVRHVDRYNGDVVLHSIYYPIRDEAGDVRSVISYSINQTAHANFEARATQNADDVISELQVFKSSIGALASEIGSAADAVTESRELANRGEEQIQKGHSAMQTARGSSAEVLKVVETIGDIAGQTNLLAFNAAVEAARAGEHGVGFSIVAEEVRKLAERNADAARDIAGLIETSDKDLDASGTMLEKTSETLERIAKKLEASFDALESCKSTNERCDGVGNNISRLATGILERSS